VVSFSFVVVKGVVCLLVGFLGGPSSFRACVKDELFGDVFREECGDSVKAKNGSSISSKGDLVGAGVLGVVK
jgi:hypothetical protein